MSEAADIASLLARGSNALSSAGIDGAAREARLILQHVSAIPVAAQIAFSERKVAAEAVALFDQAVARRRQREPLSHILGFREFWSLSFRVTRDTLDPRPDSETLIEAVLEELKQSGADWRTRNWRLVDFGTGTGCLLLALLSELPQAQGLGIDLNPAAVVVARENAKRLGLADRALFQEGNWDQGLTESFDVVLSNPPYIPSADIAGLQPEVARYEPHLALDGGADGLVAYRCLADVLSRRMKPGGLAALEVGAGQAGDVVALMQQAGLRHVRDMQDLQGHERVVLLRKS